MLRRATVPLRRRFSTAEVAEKDPFVVAWKRIVPNIDPPKTPLAFAHPPPSPDTPSKLTVNLISPHSSFFSGKLVDMVTIPATTGLMAILPGHIPSISELKPGLLSVHEGEQVTKYFISSGFAYVHSNSITDVLAAEAVPVEQIDLTAVQNALTEFTQKLSTASTDMEQAEAQIVIDVLTAMSSLSE